MQGHQDAIAMPLHLFFFSFSCSHSSGGDIPVADEVCRMPESFGARLRQQRERQQIALASIAEQTKIGLSLLEALERDDISHWPSGIFRRSFIRTYAERIGLEPDVVVREFLTLYPDPIDIDVVEAPSAIPPHGGDAPAGGPPPTRLRYLLASAVGSVSRLRFGLVEPNRVSAPERLSAPANVTVVDPNPRKASLQPEPDLLAAAQVCTELGRICDTCDAAPLLRSAARILGAVGLIVWAWDPKSDALKPVLAYGYSAKVLARLPRVRRDADNATAAAFRSIDTCVVTGRDLEKSAVVVPLITRVGCAGVLAAELPQGSELQESVRALTIIFAAQLAGLVGTALMADAVNV